MKKRNISLLLSLLLISSCCVPASIAAEPTPTFSTSSDTLIVSQNESGLYVVNNPSTRSTASNKQEPTYVFVKENDNFYYTEDSNFTSDFRVYLEEDGSLTPVNKVVLDTTSNTPTLPLITDYGFSANSQLVRDIDTALEQGFNGEISVYASTYNDYTKYVNGKLVSTDFVEYSGQENDGGTTIARKGERGVTSSSTLETVRLNLYCYDSAARGQSRLGAGTLLSFFGKTAFNLIKQAFENAPTSNPYVMLCPGYNAVMRYTNVIENGMEYIGCISNKVDVSGNLVFYSVTNIVVDPAVVSGSFQSDHFGNTAAEQAAVNNYLVGGYIDKIDDYSVVVTYPNASTRTFTFGVT